MIMPRSFVPRPRRGTKVGSSFLRVVAALTAIAVLAALGGRAQAAGLTSGRLLYPDLGVAPLDEVYLVSSGGKRELRFTTKIVNVGEGPMAVAALRMNVHSDFATWQRVRKSGGGWAQLRTPDVKLVYIGSREHGHWHVRRAARYRLVRLDTGKPVRTGVKVGFCYFDDTTYRASLPGAPQRPVYAKAACGTPGDLRILTGISVGWLDAYYWRIPGQSLDVTGLPSGRYRLSVTADPENWFRETNERNNTTWVDFSFSPQRGATQLRHGPRP
jgi:hypothetical protein